MATGLVDLNRDGILDRVTTGWVAPAKPVVTKVEIGEGADRYVPLQEVQKLKGAKGFFEVGKAAVRGFYVKVDRAINPETNNQAWGLQIFVDIGWEFDKPLFPEPVFAAPLFIEVSAKTLAEQNEYSGLVGGP